MTKDQSHDEPIKCWTCGGKEFYIGRYTCSVCGKTFALGAMPIDVSPGWYCGKNAIREMIIESTPAGINPFYEMWQEAKERSDNE